jgi:hypothetical protein
VEETRHPGLDPESMNTGPRELSRTAFMDSGFRRNDGYVYTFALAFIRKAQFSAFGPHLAD